MKKILPLIIILAVGVAGYLFVTKGDDQSSDTAETQQTARKQTHKRTIKTLAERENEAAFLFDDDPVGKKYLQGLVLDQNGKEVPDAIITVDSRPRKNKTTDENGSFTFEDLLPKTYSLTARSDKGVAGPVAVNMAAQSDPIILTLTEGSSLDVTVLDAESKEPVANATVNLRGTEKRNGTTDSEGIAKLTNLVPDVYRIAVEAEGFAPKSSWVRATKTSERKILLEKGQAVAGIVLDSKEAPVKGAMVIYSGVSGWSQQGARENAAISDKDGKFSFPALPGGTFRFIATHEKHAPGTSEPTTLSIREATDNVVIKMPPGVRLAGTVFDKAGQPLASARVRTGVKVDGMDWSAPRQAYTAEDGTFEFGGLPEKTMNVAALHDSGNSEVKTIDLSESNKIDLTIDQTLSISGKVVDSEGEDVEGAQVSAFPDIMGGAKIERSSWRLKGMPTALTDAGGEFVLSGLAPGDYKVNAAREGAQRRRRRMRGGEVFKAGAEDVVLRMPKLGSIKGKVELDSDDALTEFSVGAGPFSGVRQTFKDTTKFEVKDIAPGTYTFNVSGKNFQTKRIPAVEVKEGETVDLGEVKLTQGRYISGRVISSDGKPVDNATVLAGGMLFGDGTNAKAQFGGPPGARNAKSGITGADGTFIIFGVRKGSLMLTAEHTKWGRARSMMLPKTAESLENLEITLEPFGSLEGKITQSGKPVEKVIVSVQSTSAPGSVYGVQTGTDGRYKLDRLAPDKYRVSAMVGSFMHGMKTHRQEVTVSSGKTAKADINVSNGNITAKITIAGKDGEVGFAQVFVEEGIVSASTVHELTLMGKDPLGDTGGWYMSFAGMPVTLKDFNPGKYTACMLIVPKEVEMQAVQGYVESQGDDYPISCHTIELAGSPAEQAVTISVPVPPYQAPSEQET